MVQQSEDCCRGHNCYRGHIRQDDSNYPELA
jgi:hypothetical protein